MGNKTQIRRFGSKIKSGTAIAGLVCRWLSIGISSKIKGGKDQKKTECLSIQKTTAQKKNSWKII